MDFGTLLNNPSLHYEYSALVEAITAHVADPRRRGCANNASAAVKRNRLLGYLRTGRWSREQVLGAVAIDAVLVRYWKNIIADLDRAEAEYVTAYSH